MMKPTIHLNGTSRLELLRQLEEAALALDKAIGRLHDASPNGRDYYPQGDDAINKAVHEHVSRLERVKSVYNEIVILFDVVSE